MNANMNINMNMNTNMNMNMNMPGMLTPAQMDTLTSSSGIDFEKHYLTYMIHHHQGALTMVDKLLATRGGVRDPILWQMTVNIDADQRAEIARMQNLLSNFH